VNDAFSFKTESRAPASQSLPLQIGKTFSFFLSGNMEPLKKFPLVLSPLSWPLFSEISGARSLLLNLCFWFDDAFGTPSPFPFSAGCSQWHYPPRRSQRSSAPLFHPSVRRVPSSEELRAFSNAPLHGSPTENSTLWKFLPGSRV